MTLLKIFVKKKDSADLQEAHWRCVIDTEIFLLRKWHNCSESCRQLCNYLMGHWQQWWWQCQRWLHWRCGIICGRFTFPV